MLIAGDGITGTVEVKVKPDFRPITTLALQWFQLDSGNWKAVDRTSAEDTYEAEIRTYGTEATIDSIIDAFEDNRTAGSGTPYVLTLSSFESTEHIFGEDVDHSSSISATVLSIGQKEQRTWKGFGLALRLQALSPSFTGSPSLPTLQYLGVLKIIGCRVLDLP